MNKYALSMLLFPVWLLACCPSPYDYSWDQSEGMSMVTAPAGCLVYYAYISPTDKTEYKKEEGKSTVHKQDRSCSKQQEPLQVRQQ